MTKAIVIAVLMGLIGLSATQFYLKIQDRARQQLLAEQAQQAIIRLNQNQATIDSLSEQLDQSIALGQATLINSAKELVDVQTKNPHSSLCKPDPERVRILTDAINSLNHSSAFSKVGNPLSITPSTSTKP